MKSIIKTIPNPIGAYYFKYEDLGEGLELVKLRLYKVKSKNTFLLRDKLNNKVVLSKKQLDEFSILEPDGLIAHVLASDPMQGIDTICLLYSAKDIINRDPVPYAVCRQNIVDPFETILNNDINTTYVGVSISKDTAPPDFDFKSVTMAAGVRDQYLHFVYKEDTLEDILKFVKEPLFDKALEIINSHMSDVDGIKYKGFCKDYKSLLIENNFMYDFKRCFDIIQIKISIDINRWTDEGIYLISQDDIRTFESLTKHYVLNPILIKYDRTIDLDAIKRTYILFEDINKELYIISYDKGEYVNREYDVLEDQRDKDLLLNVIGK